MQTQYFTRTSLVMLLASGQEIKQAPPWDSPVINSRPRSWKPSQVRPFPIVRCRAPSCGAALWSFGHSSARQQPTRVASGIVRTRRNAELGLGAPRGTSTAGINANLSFRLHHLKLCSLDCSLPHHVTETTAAPLSVAGQAQEHIQWPHPQVSSG